MRSLTAPLTFEEVYRLYAAPIYRFCVSQLRDPHDAEDVAGDVFAAAFSAYDRAPPDPDRVLPWLFRIARNAITDRQRRLRRWRSILALLPRDDAGGSVEALAMTRADLRLAISSLQGLRERDRLLVGLRLAAELSHAEIGAVLGISEHAATVAAGRAIERLRQRVEAGR